MDETLTEEQKKEIQDKLDEWTYPETAPQLLNYQLDEITFIRVVKNNSKSYTLLRAWWTGYGAVLSCAEQNKSARIVLERLCKIMKR